MHTNYHLLLVILGASLNDIFFRRLTETSLSYPTLLSLSPWPCSILSRRREGVWLTPQLPTQTRDYRRRLLCSPQWDISLTISSPDSAPKSRRRGLAEKTVASLSKVHKKSYPARSLAELVLRWPFFVDESKFTGKCSHAVYSDKQSSGNDSCWFQKQSCLLIYASSVSPLHSCCFHCWTSVVSPLTPWLWNTLSSPVTSGSRNNGVYLSVYSSWLPYISLESQRLCSYW